MAIARSPRGAPRRRAVAGAIAWALVAVAAQSGCRDVEPPRAVHAPRVLVATVETVDFEERIEVTGELEARLETTLAAKVGGEVTEITAGEGAPVERGEIVLEIDPHRRRLELDAARATLVQARASLEQQRRQVERFRALQEQGVAARAQLDEIDLQFALADAQVAAAQAQVEMAEQALEDASVRAPFGGLTGRRHVSLGQFVQVGTPLLELVALDPIEVVFHVAEIDSALVERGQSVAIRVAPYPNETFRATVEVIFPTLDPQSRTLRVKATLANADGRLRPGLFARADLGIAQRTGVTVVPDEAVLMRSDGAVVFRLRPDQSVERQRIEIGSFYNGSIEVRAGLRPGEIVVTRGHLDLVDGARVEVVETAAARPATAKEGGR